MAETKKAHARRLAEGWFDRFCPADRAGIDIGCGKDPVHPTFRQWDQALGCGDATRMLGVPDGVFRTVYASHVLEHVADPVRALRSWYSITAPGGHLCVIVPDWRTYEGGKAELPSRWNDDHKTYWLPDGHGDRPHVRGLRATIAEAIPAADVVWFREPGEDVVPATETAHGGGEYSIEAVVRKPPRPAPPPPDPAAASVLVLSAATPGYDPGGIVAANHARFARLTGHRQLFLTEGFDPARPASWSKLQFLLGAIATPPPDGPEWVFWIDADAVFLRPADLRQFAADGCDLVIGKSPDGVNAGAMLVRNSHWAGRLIRRVWDLGDDWRWRHHSWWDQAALRHLMETDSEVAGRVRIVPHRLFNSHPHAGPGAYAEGDLVAHFAGGTLADKQAHLRQWAGRLAE